MTEPTIKGLARIEVVSTGPPVSFKTVFNFCKSQYIGKVEDYQVAEALTELIKEGDVVLYCDGISFNPGPSA